MGKSVFVGKKATIISSGHFEWASGIVTAYNSRLDEAVIRINDDFTIITKPENISQDEEYLNRKLQQQKRRRLFR